MINPIDIKYAQRLRGLRLTRDLKQSQAAKLLGFNNQQMYSKLENGQSTFTDELIKKVCVVFEISAEDFTNPNPNINFSNSPNSNSPNSSFLNNDTSVIHQLIKSKDELIAAKEDVINLLKKQLDGLKAKKS
jgi:transcriptional regulator with XRE-family HTH domain